MRSVLLAAVLIVFAIGQSVATAAHATSLSPLQPDAVQGDAAQGEAAQGEAAQDAAPLTIENLDTRLKDVEGNFPLPNPGGGIVPFVLILFAAFAALWAQNSGRNAWLWFFLGFVFSFITAFVILHKNAMDLQAASAKPKPKAKV